MHNLTSMVITVNQAKIKNKQQHYHSLRTQASLENHNNNNTDIYTIINFREHIFRHKANALRCHHHLTCISYFLLIFFLTSFPNPFFFNVNIILNEVRREGINFNRTKIIPHKFNIFMYNNHHIRHLFIKIIL